MCVQTSFETEQILGQILITYNKIIIILHSCKGSFSMKFAHTETVCGRELKST